MRFSTLMTAAAVAAAFATAAFAQAPAGGGGGGGRDPAAAFKAMDKNGDGSVSKDEWVAAGRQPDRFDTADTNHDGKLTMEEMAAARGGRGGGGGGGGGGQAPAQ